MSIQSEQNYFFIHNVFAHFFDDSLNYFADYLYPRFKHQVVGTYDKAVEYINKKAEYGNEHDMPNLPAIILNPSGEFNISDAITGAHQLWRFPNISNGNEHLKCVLYDPIYQDGNVTVNPIFVRLKGDFELIMLLNSFYEYCDMKLYMLQMFGGMNRPIYPSTFRTFLIIPDEMLNYEYINPVDGSSYFLNWESAGAYETLVKTTNRNEIVVPVNITPRYTLVGLSDASMKYGGSDKLADWRLSVTVEYEIEMPWYVFINTDYLIENVNFNFSLISYMGDTSKVLQDATSYDEFLNYFNWNDIYQTSVDYDWGYQDGVHNPPADVEQVDATKTIDSSTWEKAGFYFYTFTEDDINNLDNNIPTDGFIIPFKPDADNILHVMSKYGQLTLNLDYTIEDSGTGSNDILIRIIKNTENQNIIWKVDDILEIYTFIKIV